MASSVRVGTLRTAALIAATIFAWLQGGALALASSGCEAVQGGRLSLKDGVVEFAAVDGFAVGDKLHYQIKAGPRDGSGGLVAVLPGGATSNIASVNGFGAVHGTYTVQNPLDSIVATASGSASMTVQCTPAPLKLKSLPSATHQVGQPYLQTNTGSGGTTPYAFSVFTGVVPAGTTLDPKNSTVSGTPTAAGPYSYTIKITDSSNPPQTETSVMSGIIDPPTLTTPPTASATGQVGQPFSQTNEAKGGTPPYTYLLARGDTLPDGTALDSKTGMVSGTPTKAGAFSYTIKVKDSGKPTQRATSLVSAKIDPPPPPPLTITSTASSNTQVGQSYSQTNEAKGGTPPYKFSYDGTLPAGTKLDESTGVVSGTLTAAGPFKYTVKVTDNGSPQQTATGKEQNGTITPTPPTPLTIKATPSAITQVGQSYSQTNAASGGTPPYKYSLAPGATLPPGTKLDESTGTVSGKPTAAGPFSYVVQVEDAGSPKQTASTPVTGIITVRPTVMLVSMASATFQVGQSYSQANVGSGGTPPYTFSISAGAAPVGTKLDDKSGTVSGTPTTAGAYSYTIQVKDSGDPPWTATNPVSGPIAPAPLTMTSAASSITEVGQPYSQTNAAGAGISPYIYWVADGDLPDGTTLNSLTGEVSGRPTRAGVFSYKIKAADSCGWWQTVSAVVTGSIAPATLTISATPSPTTRVGQLYSQTNVARGGTPPYKYAVLPGNTLPAGTTLDEKNGLVSGTPTTAGPFSYTIQVTDSGNPVQTATTTPVSGKIDQATLTITATPSATTRVGQSYFQTNVASGGTSPYKYSLASGAPPPGTNFDASTGIVSGTASMAGTFSYVIQATDSSNPVQTANTPPISGTIAATQCCKPPPPPPPPSATGCRPIHHYKHRPPPCLEGRARRSHLSYTNRTTNRGLRRDVTLFHADLDDLRDRTGQISAVRPHRYS